MKNRIKQLRQNKKISLAKLSQCLKDLYDIKISPQTLMRYEKEETQPSVYNAYIISQYFDVSVGYLMVYDD